MDERQEAATQQRENPAPELLYFVDPMCSWCWGFAPVITRLAARYSGELPLRLFVGGLAVGVEKPLGRTGKAKIEEHWRHVEKDTGQTFDYAFFERDGFVYNSELPSYAIVAVRNANLDALYFCTALQKAFYECNLDITSPSTLIDIAREKGLDEVSFRASLTDPLNIEDAKKDFELTQRLGIQGFPALLGMANNKIELLTMGYQNYESLVPRLDAWREGL